MKDQARKNKKKDKNVKTAKPWWNRGLKILLRIFFIVFALLLILILVIRSPWGQDLITGQATKYVSNKTGTEVSIEKLFITFSGDLDLQGLYLEDKKKDTLLYSKELRASVPLWPIIRNKTISINKLHWEGLRANVVQEDSIEGFNYQFLIDAFASDSTETKEKVEPEPEEDGEPMNIAVNRIDFSDFKLIYDDAVAGMKADVALGKLHYRGKNLDLEEMRFEAKTLALEDTELMYEQTKPMPETEDTTETELPFVGLDEIKLNNVKVHYKSIPDSMEAKALLADFLLELPKADLANQDIEIGQLALKESDIQFKTEAQNKTEPEEESTSGAPEPIDFEWPDWKVKVAAIDFADNHLLYQNGSKPEQLNQFDADYIDIDDFVLAMDDILLSDDESIEAVLKETSFTESSGFDLKNMAFTLNGAKTNLDVADFIVETNHSSLSADIKTDYPALQEVLNDFEQAELTLDIADFDLDLKDAFHFQPDLKENEYLYELSKQKIKGSLAAKGKLAEMDLTEFLVEWGPHTKITTHGKFKNLTDTDRLELAVDALDFKTIKSDVNRFLDEKELGISIPEDIHVVSQLKGRLNDVSTHTQLITSDGKINLDGRYADTDQLAFDANLKVDELNLGKILNNESIGILDFNTKASGQGRTLNDLTAELNSEFSKLEFNDYDFSALVLEGDLEQGNGDFDIMYKDDNLDLAINSALELDTVRQKVQTDFKLNGADFNKLGLMDKEIKGKLMMNLGFVHDAHDENRMDLTAHISEGSVVYDDRTHLLGTVDLMGMTKQDSTSLDIDSDFLNGYVHSNASAELITEAIDRQFNRYLADADSIAAIDTISTPVNLEGEMHLSEHDLISDVFLTGLEEMSDIDFKVDFDQKKDLLTADLVLPYLNYSGNIIDDLYFSLNSTKDAGQFIFGFQNLDAGAFGMNRTFWNGDLMEGVLTMNFYAFDEQDEKFYSLHSETTNEDNELKFHVLPYDLILNKEPWSVPEENYLKLANDSIAANDFVISQDNKKVEVANDLMNIKRNNIGLGFENFNLKTLLALFNPDDHLASGLLQGKTVAVNPFEHPGFLADLGIDSLEVLQVPLGDLSVKALARGLDKYRFKMDLKGDDVDVDLKGNYTAADTTNVNLDLDLNKFGFKTIAKLSGEELKDASGYLSGEFSLNGDLPDPAYEGKLMFNDAGFKVAEVNSEFYLSNDQIDIDEKGVHFDSFSIEDAEKNKLSINGSVLTDDFTNPEFDLKLDANNFQLMNSTEKDNDTYYGTINLDTDGTIKGDLNFPKIDMNVGVNKETDFTYVYSQSQASMEKREGILEFVNKQDEHEIVTEDQDSIQSRDFGGMELHAKLNIDKRASFGAIIDPQTGDNLKVSGDGDLDFHIKDNGMMSLSGRFTIDKGHYKMSLYHLVAREFEFKQGSTITWTGGDPTDADIDVTAIYETKTSAAGLMASGGQDAAESGQYQQRLPFLVSLNAGGTIDKPELTFGLDMPEDSKGALGGAVYGRVNQVQEDEGELNKQVFSLLVLNRFFPDNGSDGGEGGFANMARNNLNDALSDQLNNFSDQLMGNTGIKLNFGLDSYTDYQGESAQDRTDLSISAEKKLFNDRLVVKAGTDVNVQGDARPGEENPLLGNVSIEYLLTEDGRWRIRGFRKDEYENVIDGQVFVNGLGLMFEREFNNFSYLWRSFIGNPERYYSKKRKEREKEKEAESSDE